VSKGVYSSKSGANFCKRDAKEAPSNPVMVMRDWSMSESSRVRHGDTSNVSNKARGIFLDRRRRSSSERLFWNFFLYLECFFTTGEPPVTVILKRSNLNVHEDGVIQWRASIRGVGVEPCFCYWCAKNFKCTFFCASVHQKTRSHI
jgi:hypothetical protein